MEPLSTLAESGESQRRIRSADCVVEAVAFGCCLRKWNYNEDLHRDFRQWPWRLVWLDRQRPWTKASGARREHRYLAQSVVD